MKSRLQQLWSWLPSPPLLSPWQKSRSMDHTWLVREDLIGSYKSRKYLSLLPWLQQQGFREVLLHGSGQSNNVLQLALQLQRIGIRASWAGVGRRRKMGNDLLRSMLDLNPRQPDWEIPEGADCPASLPGSLTLAASLAEGMLAQGMATCEVFVDAGTGFSAAALVLGLSYLRFRGPLRVVSMTRQSPEAFSSLLQKLRPQAQELLQDDLPELPVEVLSPPTAASFGSLNATIWREVQRMAQEEGLLVDPLYAAKLIRTAREIPPRGPRALLISGGQAELLGFQTPLSHYLDRQKAQAPRYTRAECPPERLPETPQSGPLP